MISSYLSPKLEGRESHKGGGHAVFAVEPVAKGELLVVWGGVILTAAQLDQIAGDLTYLGVQVEADLYLWPPEAGPADWVNHSCAPNAGLDGQIALVALRDIGVGEEICFDYAMTDSSPYDEFVCQCGAQECRGRITGQDWRIPALQQAYAGYFAPYLARWIAGGSEK